MLVLKYLGEGDLRKPRLMSLGLSLGEVGLVLFVVDGLSDKLTLSRYYY